MLVGGGGFMKAGQKWAEFKLCSMCTTRTETVIWTRRKWKASSSRSEIGQSRRNSEIADDECGTLSAMGHHRIGAGQFQALPLLFYHGQNF